MSLFDDEMRSPGTEEELFPELSDIEENADWTEPEGFWDDFVLPEAGGDSPGTENPVPDPDDFFPAPEEASGDRGILEMEEWEGDFDWDDDFPAPEEASEERNILEPEDWETDFPEEAEAVPEMEEPAEPEPSRAPKKDPPKRSAPEKGHPAKAKNPSKKKKKKPVGLFIALGVLAVLLLTAAMLYAKAAPDAKALLNSKDTVKQEAASMAGSAAALDTDALEQSARNILTAVQEDAAILDKPLWQFAAKMPVVGGDLKNVRRLLTMAESGIQELLFPALDYVREMPELPENMDELKEDPVKALEALDVGEWMDAADRGFALADDCLPLAEELLGELADFPAMNLEKLENTVAPMREYARLGQELLPLAEDKVIPLLRDDLVPAARKLKAIGSFDELLPEEGIVNVRMLSQYLDLLDELMPTLRALPEKLAFLEKLDAEKALELRDRLLTKLDECLALYDKAEPYLPLMRAFLGHGEDKLYLMAAQNTAEIRSCGGFPGSAGYIRVEDGILTLEMSSGYRVFGGQSFVEPKELEFFLDMVAIGRDSVVDPYFPIVASRWAESHYDRKDEPVSGCISITPAIISDLLYVAGPIELSDGTTVDGENVVRFMGNEIYVKYLQTYNENLDLTDELFSEIAETTLHRVFNELTLDKLSQYIDVFAKRSQDRVIMMWFADEAEEELARQVGCDGGFNTDPTHPQIGVYFNNYFASKLGWYVDLDVEIGEPTPNPDGGLDYPVSVHTANTLKNEDVAKVGQFVIAQTGGTMGAQLYFSAPAGGYFSNYKGESQTATIFFNDSEYFGNVFMPTNLFMFPPEGEVFITFTVTTAPGEQEPLTYVTTPTYQDYR